jgi:hypothetical protein
MVARPLTALLAVKSTARNSAHYDTVIATTIRLQVSALLATPSIAKKFLAMDGVFLEKHTRKHKL